MNEKSHHIFLFPFRYENRTTFKKVKHKLEENGWKRNTFHYSKENFDQEFSAQSYFYQSPGRALFDEDSDRSHSPIVSTYTYDLKGYDARYIIEIAGKEEDQWDTKTRLFELPIEKIELNMYDVGVCILSFHLNNYKYDNFEDILLINDFGRRLYPQYLTKGEQYITASQGSFLAKSISLKLSEGVEIYEDFFSYNTPSDSPFRLPSFIERILPKDYAKTISWLLDDRMFVISALVDNDKSNSLSKSYQGNEDWYKYTFVDNRDCTCKNARMLRELIKKSTYTRWSEYGSLFGISRYSFMLLTGEGGRFILGHIRNMYYKMICLCLLQRACVLFYSARIFNISKQFNQIKRKEDEQLIFEDIRKLNKDYIYFINNIYFREITAQEQGIELYDCIQQQMRVEREVKDLSSEIDQLYQYINMAVDNERNHEASKLNKIAAIFLPATLFAGIFGMNSAGDAGFPSTVSSFLQQAIFVGGATIIMYFVIKYISKRRR